MIQPQIFHSRLIEKAYLNKDVIKISFEVPNDFQFQAGQFFNILFDPADVKTMRSYSILNPPSHKGVLQSAVKIIDDGYGSQLLKAANIGDEFKLRGPVGVFTMNENTNNEQILICTGTGVTPYFSILFEHVKTHTDKKFTLIFGAKTLDDLIFHKDFEELQKHNTNFTYLPTLSREDSVEWSGLKGRVQEHLTDFKNKDFYICGLKEMIKDVRDVLLKNGVDMKNIHIERYT